MKDKRSGGEDWYRPWVVRPDLLRATERTSRISALGRATCVPKGRSSSSNRLNDIGAKLEVLERGPTPNRMTAGYSLANLSQLTEDLTVGANHFHSLCYTPESALSRSFDDTLDDYDDETSLFSLQLSPSGDLNQTSSHFFARQKIVQKTLSLPFRYLDHELSDGNKLAYGMGREGPSSILTNKTPNKRGRVRRCPSPHAKIANGVFLPQESRDDNESISFNKLHNSKKKTAQVHEGMLRCHSGRSSASEPSEKSPRAPTDEATKGRRSAREELLEDSYLPNARSQHKTTPKLSSTPDDRAACNGGGATAARMVHMRANRGRANNNKKYSSLPSPCDTCPCHRTARPHSFDGSAHRCTTSGDVSENSPSGDSVPDSPTAPSLPDTPRDKASQESVGSRSGKGPRQADSLEDVCGEDHRLGALEHGSGLAGQPASVIATSLPHINQLSGSQDSSEHLNCPPSAGSSLHLHKQPLYINPNLQGPQHAASLNNSHHNSAVDVSSKRDNCADSSAISRDDASAEETFTKFEKRPDKANKSKLKRRPPYYRTNKDAPSSGRSKSLTHIDTLGGDGPANAAMLGGSDDGGGEGGDGPWTGPEGQHQLGVPHDNSHRRKKLSLHSKVSSSEYILVVSESQGGGDLVDELIPASRGTTLREALERLGYDVSGASIVIEDTTTSVHPSTETSVLGGKTLRYRGRDTSRSPVRTRSAGPSPGQLSSRKQSNTRAAQGWFHRSAASTEDNSPLVDDRGNGGPASQDVSTKASSKVSKPNNRWSIFLHKDPRMDALVQKLDLYSKQGIPHLPHLLPGLSTHPADEELVLEAGGWHELVAGWGELGERLRQQQSVIWELVETEATYCNKIRVITNLFLSCLRNLQNEQLLNDINTELLFSNIPDIYHTNLTFWKEHISVMLAEARKTKQPLDPTLLYGAFTNFNDLFKPYSLYCQQQSQCQQYCKERYHDNEHFKLYLAWCETQKECNRLRLVDILVEPMQRLTKYSLLLKAILKKTDVKEHKWKLNEMITNVECFVSNVNSALRHRHEQERLRDTIGRIEAYDAVEAREEEIANKVKQYSELQLSQPMPGCPEHLSRHLLHQGDYKLRDHHTSKTDVHVFIFTDLLLVTKVTQRKAEKVKVIRPPYNIERLLEVVIGGRDSTTLGLVVLSEWGVASGAFSLQSPDTAAHRALQEAIKKAKKQYVDAQSGGRDMLEEITSGLRSPRLASSRASRGSSLAPSQSGSVDLTDPGYAHPTSPAMLEVSELRASSASSEDSVEGPRIGHHSVDVPSRPSAVGQHLNVTSSQASGQSLPNLSVVSGNSHLKVPSHKNHAPWNRGVSYPPPSPRALRRSPPVPQSHHPPLLKTRHVVSTTGAAAAAAAAAQTASGLSDSRQAGQLEEEDGCRSPRRACRSDRADNRRYYTAGAIDDIKKQDTKDSSIHKRLSWNCGQQQVPPQPALQQQIQQASAPGGLCASCSSQTFVTPSNSTCSSSSSSRLTCSPSSSSRLVGQCDNRRHKLSCECVHSSSGVSSTSSLHRSVTSEVETLENPDDSEDGDRTIVDLGIGECNSSTAGSSGGGSALSPLPDYSSRFSPHISSTYICQDVTGVLSGSAQYITQVHPDGSEGEESALSPAMVTIDVSNTCSTTPSGVQITVTEGPNPTPDTSPHPPILEHDPSDVSPSQGPTQRMTTSGASSNREQGCRGRSSVPALPGRVPPSTVPPEVPPRTSSPKLPIKRTTSGPQSSAGSCSSNLVNETCSGASEKVPRSNECLVKEQLDSSSVLSEAAKVGSDSFVSSESYSLSAVVRNDDSESLFRSIPKLPSISETRSINSETPNSKADESFPEMTKFFPTSDCTISSTSSPSVSTSSSSSISSPPTADSSLSSASSSSKCASNSYSSLSSVSSSTSPSKQSLSRENSGMREMLLTDSAAETSDV